MKCRCNQCICIFPTWHPNLGPAWAERGTVTGTANTRHSFTRRSRGAAAHTTRQAAHPHWLHPPWVVPYMWPVGGAAMAGGGLMGYLLVSFSQHAPSSHSQTCEVVEIGVLNMQGLSTVYMYTSTTLCANKQMPV